MPSSISIAVEAPDQAEIAAFFRASEAYMAALYPAESNRFVDVDALMGERAVFLVARDSQRRAIGCGAVILGGDDCGEIKRMWVDPDARGLKLGKRLLVALEAEARARGVRLLQLDAYRNRKRWGSIAQLVFGNARRSATIRLTR